MLKTDWARIDRDWLNSKRAILAYHVGGWSPGESPLDALARALGVGSKDLQQELAHHTAERLELDQLSVCLEADWVDLSELSIQEGVAFAISLLNEKLEDVPAQVRDFFGAPRRLGPSLASVAPLSQGPNLRGDDLMFRPLGGRLA